MTHKGTHKHTHQPVTAAVESLAKLIVEGTQREKALVTVYILSDALSRANDSNTTNMFSKVKINCKLTSN